MIFSWFSSVRLRKLQHRNSNMNEVYTVNLVTYLTSSAGCCRWLTTEMCRISSYTCRERRWRLTRRHKRIFFERARIWWMCQYRECQVNERDRGERNRRRDKVSWRRKWRGLYETLLEESHWRMQKLNVLFRGLDRQFLSTKIPFLFRCVFQIKSLDAKLFRSLYKYQPVRIKYSFTRKSITFKYLLFLRFPNILNVLRTCSFSRLQNAD